MKRLIAIPAPIRFAAPWEFVRSLLDVADFDIEIEHGSLIDENRNSLAAKARKYDQVLFIDTDMVFKRSDVLAIFEALDKHDIVCGLFRRGHFPYLPALYEWEGRFKKVEETPDEPFKVAACGMAFTAMNTFVLNDIASRPFERIAFDNILWGEDLSFCYRATDAGHEIWCHPEIDIKHLRTTLV